jgi:acyl carrier protein
VGDDQEFRVMEIKSRVRAFIATNFYVPQPSDLSDDGSLIDQGILDSTGVLEIIGFLEDSFGISVEEIDMVAENLDSVDRITQFVARKLPS